MMRTIASMRVESGADGWVWMKAAIWVVYAGWEVLMAVRTVRWWNCRASAQKDGWAGFSSVGLAEQLLGRRSPGRGRSSWVVGAFMLDQVFIGREEAILRKQGAAAVCAEGDAQFVADRKVHQRRSDCAMFLSP